MSEIETKLLNCNDEDEKLCLGAVFLIEGILMGSNTNSTIPHERLKDASDFHVYTSQPWGKIAYNYLATSIKRVGQSICESGQYEVKGFLLAITLWALSAIPVFGSSYGKRTKDGAEEYPLCLHWESTSPPNYNQIVEVERHTTMVTFIVRFL